MKNSASWVLGILIAIAALLIAYWFWVPDIGALRTWDDFTNLPTMQCSINDPSVQGLTGTIYVMDGRLRADYKVENNGISVTFRTIVYEDHSTYTWADDIDFAERSTLNLGSGSTEENLFKISRCKRVWSLNPDLFVLPIGLNFRERGAPTTPATGQATSR